MPRRLVSDDELQLVAAVAVVPVGRAGRRLASWLDFVAGTQVPVVLTRKGRPDAVLYDTVDEVPTRQLIPLREGINPVRVAFRKADRAFAAWTVGHAACYVTGLSLEDALRALIAQPAPDASEGNENSAGSSAGSTETNGAAAVDE